MKKKCGLRNNCLLYLALSPLIFGSVPLKADVAVKEFIFRGGNIEDKDQYFAQDVKFWSSNVYPEEADFTGRLFKLRTAGAYFALWFAGRTDPFTGEWKSSVGMARPSMANWGGGGFYSVKINGKAVANYKTTVDEVTSGKKGIVKISWHHPDALVTTEFVLLDGDDKLIVTTKVQPKRKISGYEVQLTAHPSSYGVNWQAGFKIRDREGLTAKRILKRPQREDNTGAITVTLKQNEPWVLFYDRYFDVAENRGEGPCAVVFSPKEVTTVNTHIGNYACNLDLNYAAGDKPVSSYLVLWDFHGMSNQAAKKYMMNLNINGIMQK